jgi:hypothetical protein
MVTGAGMPHLGANYRFGDLIISFNVVFPPASALSKQTMAQLKTLIPRVMDPAQKKEGKSGKKAGSSTQSSGDEDDMEDATSASSTTASSRSPTSSTDAADLDDAAMDGEEVEDATLVDVDLAAKAAQQRESAQQSHGGGEAYEEDDQPRGRGVQCAQQ